MQNIKSGQLNIPIMNAVSRSFFLLLSTFIIIYSIILSQDIFDKSDSNTIP